MTGNLEWESDGHGPERMVITKEGTDAPAHEKGGAPCPPEPPRIAAVTTSEVVAALSTVPPVISAPATRRCSEGLLNLDQPQFSSLPVPMKFELQAICNADNLSGAGAKGAEIGLTQGVSLCEREVPDNLRRQMVNILAATHNLSDLAGCAGPLSPKLLFTCNCADGSESEASGKWEITFKPKKIWDADEGEQPPPQPNAVVKIYRHMQTGSTFAVLCAGDNGRDLFLPQLPEGKRLVIDAQGAPKLFDNP